MSFDCIYIACFRHDFRLARILVSSIRSQDNHVPIFLIKDQSYGDFDTSELERHFAVCLFQTQRNCFGWGFGKLEPLFLPDKKRCLILDADTLMIGNVLSHLDQFKEDFVVTLENPPNEEFVDRLYFNVAALRLLDPKFQYPGFTFNTGQLVATTGLLKRTDFDPFVEWGAVPQLKHEHVFRCGEQGVLNYILMKKQALGDITLKRVPLLVVADAPMVDKMDPLCLPDEGHVPFIIHWCGQTRTPDSARLNGMHGRDLLLHFERLYYGRLPFGTIRQPFEPIMHEARIRLRKIIKSLPGITAIKRRLDTNANPIKTPKL